MSKVISGLIAAPIIPLDSLGGPDLTAFDRVLDFLIDHGAEGICVGGATSEFPHFELEERKALITSAARKTRGRAILLAAAGSSSLRITISIARHALESGCRAILLPGPHFFSYEQVDLEAFCREVCTTLPAPYMLYNLPAFTTGFDIETTVRLLQADIGFVGLKDSSGDREVIQKLTEARGRRDLSLMAGSDRLILECLTAGWNGVISGNINLCPELYHLLFRSFRSDDHKTASRCQSAIALISEKARCIPFPWAIRAGMEVRGISTGPSPLPLAPIRQKQTSEFSDWFKHWLKDELSGIIKTGG